jgi:starch phosphorylase
MVSEYTNRFYIPSIDRYHRLSEDGMARGKELAAWLRRVRSQWGQLRIESVELDVGDSPVVGQNLRARAYIQLGDLRPDDVTVQLYLGGVDSESRIVDAETTTLRFTGTSPSHACVFGAENFSCGRSGMHGYTVRVLPSHPDLSEQILPGLVRWA